MDDLLKEAIADAKAVRETALENAKIALEEAFTPRLQSMLSKKIQSEIDVDEQDDEYEDEEEEEEPVDDMGDVEGYTYGEDDEDPTDDYSDEEPVDDMGDEENPEVDMEGVIEINGVKYAPIVSEDDEEEEDEIPVDDMGESDDLDLEAVLRELEGEEEDEDEAEEPVDEQKDAEEDDDDEDEEEKVDEEVDQSSGIGSSDNKKGATDKSSAIGSKGKAKHESVEETEEEVIAESDEDIDLEEVIKALSEEEDEEEAINEVAKIKADLDEHRNVIKYLRSKLNEVNLLNAKLLFTNKLFRSFGLTNDQKMKVVENFDRAHNLREVKLVYSTLAESFGTKKTKTEIKEHKGSASKAVASTKSKKQEVIAEGSELRERFKKLAGII